MNPTALLSFHPGPLLLPFLPGSPGNNSSKSHLYKKPHVCLFLGKLS